MHGEKHLNVKKETQDRIKKAILIEQAKVGYKLTYDEFLNRLLNFKDDFVNEEEVG